MTYHHVGSYYRPSRLRVRRRTWLERVGGWFDRHPRATLALASFIVGAALFSILWCLFAVKPL